MKYPVASSSSFPSALALSFALGSLGALAGCGDDDPSGSGGSGGGGAGAPTTTSSTTGSTSSSSGSTSSTSGSGSTSSGQGGQGGQGGGSGGAGSGGGGEGGGVDLCPETATTVDLEDVVARASAVLAETFGEGLPTPTLHFQDGLNAVGFPAPNDMGAIVAAVPAPEGIAIFEDQLLVYRASVWGEESVMLARVADWSPGGWDADYPEGDDFYNYWAPGSGLGIFTEAVTEEEGNALALDFETAFPGSSFTIFFGDIFTFVNIEPARLGDAFDFLLAREEVDLLEADGEVYATDFGFGPRVDLTAAIGEGPIDVYEEHAFLSHWLRDEGAITFNLPTLPEPLGPGPVAQSVDARYTLTFSDGADVEACLAELAACGFTTEVEGDVATLIDPSYIAATALRHACVESIAAE